MLTTLPSSCRCATAILALLASTALASPALAQTSPAPEFVNTDQNGVDLTTGLVSFALDEGSIGSGEGAVTMRRIWAQGAGWIDNWSGGLYKVTDGGVTKAYVQIAGISDTFTGSGTSWTSDKADGATLTVDAQGFYNYTARDGTKIQFAKDLNFHSINAYAFNCPGADPETCQVPKSITRPNGLIFNIDWTLVTLCEDLPGEPCVQMHRYKRLASVTSSAGYKLTLAYATDSAGSGTEPPANWFKRTSVSFTNLASPPSPLPTVNYAYPASNVIEVTDPGGRVWRFTTSSGQLSGVRRPGSASDNISYVHGGSGGTVSSATRDGVTTSYSRIVSGSTATMTVTNALSQQSVITSDLTHGRPTSSRDALNRTTGFQYDSNARLTRVTEPEGNYVQLTHDARGNVTQTRAVAKAGSGLADIVTSASFDASCANVVKCNKPNSTTDARGSVTDYTYNSVHGGLLTATRPAPTTGAVRPQTRLSYTQVTSQQGHAVYQLTGVSACQTQSSCTGAADESKLTASYNSNLLPASLTRANGTGTLTATSTMTYDPIGNLLTVDGPLTGTADTTRARYDAARQLVGVVGPDPDGGGTLKHRAIRLTWRPDGQVSRQERGTVDSQTDAAWSAFASLEQVDIAYDANSRPLTQALASGGTTYALTQLSYDALGRPDCTAVRMNPAAFGSLPSSACTLGTTGSQGPDRITKTIYDAAGQVTENRVAVGTADAATERTLTYSSNSMLATLKDAEANLTTYEYDGHDRLAKTRLPVPTKGANASSATDFEQPSYDPNGNVVSFRNRANQTLAFTYDRLDRQTLKNLPGTEPDVTYAYDNLDRLTSAGQTGHSLTFTWDALGRNLTQAGPQGTVASQWDAAGRRTRLTYPGSGLYLTYDHLVTGEVTKIRENGATSGVGVLAAYAFDNLGRRTSLTLGNGAITTYAYDPVSRLASLTHNVSGTTNDLTIGGLAYNPASQIVSQARSNDAYAFTGLTAGSTPSVANGLNQLTSIGGSATAHDAKGNVTGAPVIGKTYGYSSENLLTSASGGVTLAYDPVMRLHQVSGAATTRFVHDGLAVIAEYNGFDILQRRFVHGPNLDEPIVQYDGIGTTNRSFLHADERGSIVAMSNTSGGVTQINKYDEYGTPAAANDGRFQYTGQMWIEEVGAYHYKARFYSPDEGGRFLQTDPLGYEDSPNLYAYVLNDPINLVDPFGLQNEEEILIERKRIDWAGNPAAAGALWGLQLRSGLAQSGLSERAQPLHPDLYQSEVVIRGVRKPKSRAAIHLSWRDYRPACDLLQRGGQSVGRFFVKVGGAVSQIGLGGSLLGIGVAAGSARTLNPTGVLIGGEIAAGFSAVTVGGNMVTVIGAGVMALSGSGKEASKQLAIAASTSLLPKGEVRDTVGELMDPALDAVIGDWGTCR